MFGNQAPQRLILPKPVQNSAQVFTLALINILQVSVPTLFNNFIFNRVLDALLSREVSNIEPFSRFRDIFRISIAFFIKMFDFPMFLAPYPNYE